MRIVRFASAVAVVALLVSGCTGTAGPVEPTGSSMAPGGTEATGQATEPSIDPPAKSAQEVTEEIFDSLVDTPSIGEQNGKVPQSAGASIDARITIQSVEAGETSTMLTFTLFGTSADEESLASQAFNEFSPLTFDIRDIAIVDADSQQRFSPYLGYKNGKGDSSSSDSAFCLCSTVPKSISTDGFKLYATFPPISSEAVTVTVSIPGFEDLTQIPVVRS